MLPNTITLELNPDDRALLQRFEDAVRDLRDGLGQIVEAQAIALTGVTNKAAPPADPGRVLAEPVARVLAELAATDAAMVVQHLLTPLLNHGLVVEGNVRGQLTAIAREFRHCAPGRLAAAAAYLTRPGAKHRLLPDAGEIWEAIGRTTATKQADLDLGFTPQKGAAA